MRIGIVCPYDWNAPGGVQAHVRNLAEQLMAMGNYVSVLAPADDEDDLPDYVVSAGRPVAVPYNGSVARVNFGVVSAARVRRWIKDGEFDVVHVHEAVSPTLSVLACWIANGPIVATQHMATERSRALSASYWLGNSAMEKVDGRIAVSQKSRQTVVEHLGGDAVLIPNGVDCAAFADPEPLPGYPRDGGTLFFIGRIDEQRKGLPLLLDAMPAVIAACPDVRLLVAGPGDVEEVRAEIDAAVAQHVEFLGLVSERDKVRAFHSADIYIAPNLGGESFGIVLLEALASGTTVLASDLEAFRLVLEEGRDGALFSTGDPASLASEVISLLGDPVRRQRLAADGLVRSREFDWATVVRDIMRVYESVVTPGVPVQADLSEQLLGRWARRAKVDD
jgi:phosphatidylinositol alpha-mannosyltransferase